MHRQYSLGCASCQQASTCGVSPDGISYVNAVAPLPVALAGRDLLLLGLLALLAFSKKGA